jgi:hypothetical protein
MTAKELGDQIYLTALQRVPMGGGIAEAFREGAGVVINGRQPGGLRGVYHPPTSLIAVVSDVDVRVVVLGGRPGIPADKDLFTLPIAGQPLQEVANEVVDRIGRYLAATTS